MNKLIGKKAILIQSVYSKLNGTTFTIIDTDINEQGETIIETDIQHPDDTNTNLWVNISETIFKDNYEHK
jgi:hypothetical protein